MSSRGMCAGNVSHKEVVSESKIARETAVVGCEGRRCETAVAAMLAYARLGSDRCSIRKWNGRW